MRTALGVATILLLVPVAGRGQAEPASLPARDSHGGVLVACDLYTDAKRAEARLGKKNPLEVGILPLEVFFQNNTGKPIRLELGSIRLLVDAPGEPRQQLEALSLDDVVDDIVNKGGSPQVHGPSRLPRPIPKASRGKKWQEIADKLGPLVLSSDVVGSNTTLHGFLFFDLRHNFDALHFARLYIPELEFMATHQPLLYFEVSLAPGYSR